MGSGVSTQLLSCDLLKQDPILSIVPTLPEPAIKRVNLLISSIGKGRQFSFDSAKDAVELGSRIAQKLYDNVVAVYNSTFVGAGPNELMGDNVLLGLFGRSMLNKLFDTSAKPEGQRDIIRTLAKVLLRHGQNLGVLAQSLFWGLPELMYILEPLHMQNPVTMFENSVAACKEADRLFKLSKSGPEFTGLCAAALGEVYYCACASVIEENESIIGMDPKSMLLESLRLTTEAIAARAAEGLAETEPTAHMHKDLGKVASFATETIQAGLFSDMPSTIDEYQNLADSHLNAAMSITAKLGVDDEATANIARLMSSANVKCRETAEKRGLRVAKRVLFISMEESMCNHISNQFGDTLTTGKFIPELIECVNSLSTSTKAISQDLLAYGYHKDMASVEEAVVALAEKILTPPIDKSKWIKFKTGLLQSNIWFRKSVKTKKWLFKRLLQIVTKRVTQLEKQLKEDIKPFAAGIALLSDGNKHPHQNCHLRHDELNGNDPNFKHDQLPDDDARQFYDMKVYLPQLMLVARVINDEFQEWVNTNFATFGKVCPGPIKLLERAEAKAENDYNQKKWPTSSHVIDLVRARVLCNEPSDLSSAYAKTLQLAERGLVNGYGIMGLARVKNSFLLPECQNGFRDIKISVSFRSKKGVEMICELGLNLVVFHEFGRKVHRLYEIGRDQVFFNEVAKKLESTMEMVD